MASRVLVPFDFNPVSVSVKTGSYTIPAGKYARAIVNVIGSGTFTINGTTALSGSQNNVITNVNNLYRDNRAATVSGISVVQGGLISGSGQTGAGSGVLLVYGNETDQKPLVHDYFLPTGTVINGTGTWRATVEEYNIIS